MSQTATSPTKAHATPIEHMYHTWDKALSDNDASALLALYAPDTVFESPLVPHLLGLERPLRGREELKMLFDKLAPAKAGRPSVLPHRLPH